MLTFVNAKINIGLQIVNRREDGYHDLQTVFYPIGIHAGLPENPVSFCDILEINPSSGDRNTLTITGNPVNCPLEQNLVWKAVSIFFDTFPINAKVDIHFDKHIPDGAGIGGGSADALFTLTMLADMFGIDRDELFPLALKLGADCPFFLLNRCAYAEGVGEQLTPVDLDLSGKWLLLIKPDIYVSTKEAFSGVVPKKPSFHLRGINEIPMEEWKECVHNDFEDSLFPLFPQLAQIKVELYNHGAIYASLTGSGSCLYGIFGDKERGELASEALRKLFPTLSGIYLLKL